MQMLNDSFAVRQPWRRTRWWPMKVNDLSLAKEKVWLFAPDCWEVIFKPLECSGKIVLVYLGIKGQAT